MVPFLVIGLMSYISARDALQNNISQQIAGVSHEVARQIGIDLGTAFTNVEAWTTLDLMQDVLTDDEDNEIEDQLHRTKERFQLFDDFAVLNSAGLVIASTIKDIEEQDLSKLPLYAATTQGRSYQGHMEQSGLNGKPGLTFGYPVRADYDHDTIIGTLVAFVSWKAFRQNLSSVYISGVKQGPRHRLVLIVRKTLQQIYQTAAGATADEAYANLPITEGFGRYPIDGKISLIGTAITKGTGAFADPGWIIHAIIDSDTAFESVVTLRDRIAVIGAVILILLVLVAYFAATLFVRPIMEIIGGLKRAAKGDLEFNLALDERSDEIGDMAAAVDVFKKNTFELKNAEQELRGAFEIISSSINYASRIQRSVLPNKHVLDAYFEDYFILWEPRDVVGGDIYWTKQWGDGVLFVLGDCTGHGVPGAFMTLISIGAMDRALAETPEGNVGRFVQRAHQMIQNTLGQDSDSAESDDGVELGACFINPKDQKLTFVGARFDLFEVQSNEVRRYKGNKKGIGYGEVPQNQDFTEITIDIAPATTFYMTTDGAVDQISDTEELGFGKKRFENIILEIQDKSMGQQEEAIHDALLRHQGTAPRLDDVAIVGFKTLTSATSGPSTSTKTNSVPAIHRIQDSLDAQGILFFYSGYMAEDILLSMGKTLRKRLELVNVDKAISRSIFSIFVEEAQNIIRYSSDVLRGSEFSSDELRRGSIAIGEDKGRYYVSCGNLIIKADVDRLRQNLVAIAGMDEKQLRTAYKEVLRGDIPEGSKGAGVGFIDIARRAQSGLEFDFMDVDDNYSYFFLKASI